MEEQAIFLRLSRAGAVFDNADLDRSRIAVRRGSRARAPPPRPLPRWRGGSSPPRWSGLGAAPPARAGGRELAGGRLKLVGAGWSLSALAGACRSFRSLSAGSRRKEPAARRDAFMRQFNGLSGGVRDSSGAGGAWGTLSYLAGSGRDDGQAREAPRRACGLCKEASGGQGGPQGAGAAEDRRRAGPVLAIVRGEGHREVRPP